MEGVVAQPEPVQALVKDGRPIQHPRASASAGIYARETGKTGINI